MIKYCLLLMFCFHLAKPQDTIVSPNSERIAKSRWTKMESSLQSALELYENDIQNGISPQQASIHFNGFNSDKNGSLYLEINTNGNDFDVQQAIVKLGGNARISVSKKVYCCVPPNIIHKIAELENVVNVNSTVGPVHRRR